MKVIGIAEVCKLLVGSHHGETEKARKLAYDIVKCIRTFCDEATERDQLNITCYATPAEGLSNRFTDMDRERFGEIEWVTSKGFYTNSFHVPVDYPISAIDKLSIEAPFHELCNAGHISYFECDGPPTESPKSIEKLIRYIFTTTQLGYVGVNFGIRYCKDCGQADIKGSKCPNCNSIRIQEIDRVTGYLSLHERLTKGKNLEVAKRIPHSY